MSPKFFKCSLHSHFLLASPCEAEYSKESRPVYCKLFPEFLPRISGLFRNILAVRGVAGKHNVEKEMYTVVLYNAVQIRTPYSFRSFPFLLPYVLSLKINEQLLYFELEVKETRNEHKINIEAY